MGRSGEIAALRSVATSVPRPEKADRRASRLLVALNSAAEVDRATLCRLGACGHWLDGLGRGAPRELSGVSGEALAEARARLQRFEELAEREELRARDAGASIITRLDPGYPAALLELPQPPPVLYCRGRLPPGVGIAVVGSRLADTYGLETARMFARYLADRGVVVVSGLARGVDSAAHRGALEAEGGRTVAVLGCGIDVEYPRGSARLARRIAAAGAVVTEFPIGIRPHKFNFPMRNRIIAALGAGTMVVRATSRSGSLITARLALELGRDVYALPGNIFDPRSIGPNTLIRDGALPVQHPREMIESLPSRLRAGLEPHEPAPTSEPGTPAEHLEDVYRRLSRGETRTAESLAAETGKPVAAVLAALTELELGGWATRYPGPSFCRRG